MNKKLKMIKIKTEATLNEEARMIFVKSQHIFLDDLYICSLPARRLELFKEFTSDQLIIINKENIGSVLSQKLLYQLLKVQQIKNLIREINGTAN